MKNRVLKNPKFWLILSAVLIAIVIVGQFLPKKEVPQLQAPMTEAQAEGSDEVPPAAMADQQAPDIAVPAKPGLPVRKLGDTETIVAEQPLTNGVDGDPQILKTSLGLPVSPLCFDTLNMVDGPKQVDVTTCEALPDYKNIETSFEKGQYRTSYQFPAEQDAPAETGYSAYNVIGRTTNGLAVQTYSESGGTGRFSSIVTVTLEGNLLSLEDRIAGGDRCNGGITEAHVENGELVYSVSATPGDFAQMAYGDDHGLKAYEDLEASAMSCFAEATYKAGKLQAVAFNPDALPTDKTSEDWAKQYKLQPCLNDQIKARLAMGQKNMTTAEFKSFMDMFMNSCAKQK